MLSDIRSPYFNRTRHVVYTFDNLTDFSGFCCLVSGRVGGFGCASSSRTVFYPIEFFKALGTVPAYRDDEIGLARMLCLKPSLQRHAGPRRAGFETHGVAQNSFNARDVGRRIPPARDCGRFTENG